MITAVPSATVSRVETSSPSAAPRALELVRPQWIRFGVFAIVAAALVFELVGLSPGLRRLDRQANEARSLSRGDQLLAGARSVDIDRTFLLAAKGLIPSHDTFAVAVGPRVQVSTPLTLQALPAYAQFLLLPRRETDVEHARWILCYGCDPSRFGKRLETQWTDQALLIGRLR